MRIQRMDPIQRGLLVKVQRLRRRLGLLRVRDELPQLRQRLPDVVNLLLQIHSPNGCIDQRAGLTFQRGPILLLSLPASHAAQRQIEFPGKSQHAAMTFFDELSTPFSDLPMQKTAHAKDTSAHSWTRLEHGNGPPGALQVMGRG